LLRKEIMNELVVERPVAAKRVGLLEKSSKEV
jgi:hypothetical protein